MTDDTNETFDHRKVINRGLARIAAAPIGGLDEDTDKARQAIAVYFDRLDATLGLYHWSFAGKTYRLDQAPTDGADDYVTAQKRWFTGYRYAYAMPGTRMALPRTVMTDPRLPKLPEREFTIEGDRIYCDRTPLYARFTVRVDPQIWLPAFRLAVIVALAADLAIPVTHDKDLADKLRAQAEGTPQENGRGGLIGRAIGMDAASSGGFSGLGADPLTSARLA